ncbi:hypothetical protein [Achromobacter sp. AGC39]
MRTEILSQHTAQKCAALLAAAEKGLTFASFAAAGLHEVKHTEKMLLVDPVNDDPWIFIAPDTRFVFDSIPHSGTDHLRQRTNASLCFERLAEQEARAAGASHRVGL